MKTITSILSTGVFLYGCATSGPGVSDARALFKDGKHQENIEILKALSVSANSEAQFDLGNLYAYGITVKADQSKAESFWLESCNNNFIASCTNIRQRLIHQNKHADAKKILMKASKAGDELAIKYLSEIDEK